MRAGRSARVALISAAILLWVAACGGATTTTAPSASAGPTSGGSAASQSAAPAEKATITVWAWAEVADTITERAKAEFEAANPGITVEVVKMGAWDLVDKLFAAMVSGGPVPDVAEMVRRVYPKYMGTGQMTDLTDLATPYLEGFTEGSIAELTNDGKIYGMPLETSYSTFVYNTEIFAQHGIDPDALKTWDDVKAAGEKLAADGIKICTQNIPSNGAPGVMLWNMFNIAAGVQLYNEDGSIVTGNTGASDMLAWYYGMKDVCFQATQYSPDFIQGVKDGKIAGIWGDTPIGAFLRNQVPEQAGKWANLPWPQFKAGSEPAAGRWGGSALTIPARAAHPEAAKKFVEFMTTNDAALQATWEVGGLITSYTPAWKADWLTAGDPYFTGPSAVAVLDGYDLAPTYYWGYNWLQTQSIIATAIDDTFAGTKSAADAWAEAETKLGNVAP
jgi:ABC-type glycerol-3-phosphate transport system substrate-binding protein